MPIRQLSHVAMGLLIAALFTVALRAEDAAAVPLADSPALPFAVQPLNEAADLTVFTRQQRVDQFVEDSFSPSALAFVTLGAAYDQKTEYPSAWPQGLDGYGRRFASNFGQRAIGNAVQLGVESLLREDSRHVPSGQRGFLPRASATFFGALGVSTPGGRRAVPIGQLAGAFSGGFVSRAWHPHGEDGFRNGVNAGAITFGWYIGSQMLAEFLPDLKRLFRR